MPGANTRPSKRNVPSITYPRFYDVRDGRPCQGFWLKGEIMHRLMIIALAVAVLAPLPIIAHPGGLNAEGCHNNRKTGDYHCHRGGGSAAAPSRSRPMGLTSTGTGAFRNCSAARAAGAAPVRRGSPGYGSHLDRDGDGVGCE